jgi:hypothetical protein
MLSPTLIRNEVVQVLEPLQKRLLAAPWVMKPFHGEQFGVPGAIAGKFTVSQKCLWIKQLGSAITGNDVASTEEACGRSPIIICRSLLRTPYFS